MYARVGRVVGLRVVEERTRVGCGLSPYPMAPTPSYIPFSVL